MAVLEIRLLGDPVLRTPGDTVGEITDEVRALVEDMIETMYDADGVGLAAPQVGVGRRIIVVDTRAEDEGPLVLINPVIRELGDEMEKAEEGCLSIPGLGEIVERSLHAVVEAVDADGEPVRIEADGLLARVLQHEVDHLDGLLFIDRVSPLKRSMLLKKWRKVRPEPEEAGSGA